MSTSLPPLVYACSGCSNVAQLANTLALRLDRAKLAEMSCIAGVCGNVPALVKNAQSGRRIIALDGCPLHGAKCCLSQQGVTADIHLTLNKYGLRKHYERNCRPEDADLLFDEIRAMLEKDQASNTNT